MLKKTDISKTLANFKKEYNSFISAHTEMNKFNQDVKKWETKNDIPINRAVNITYPDWNTLHQQEMKTCKKLLKATRKLIILLITQKRFGTDLFQDYSVEINIKYKNGHDSYVK